MDRNPYAPPAAVVSDPTPAPLPERPYVVKRGVLLLWISFALGLLDVGWDFYARQKEVLAAWIVALVLVVPIFGLTSLIIYKISQRRHWARVTYLILAICGYTLSIYTHVSSPDDQTDLIGTLLNTASTVADIVGIVLIFTPPANRWFRA